MSQHMRFWHPLHCRAMKAQDFCVYAFETFANLYDKYKNPMCLSIYLFVKGHSHLSFHLIMKNFCTCRKSRSTCISKNIMPVETFSIP